MKTSDDTFPRLLTEIDDLTRPDHSWLVPTDQCAFFGEYTAGKGFPFSATNGVVLNFKKSVERRGLPEWYWKERTIVEVGRAFGAALNEAWLADATLVPIPPSKAKTDPLYDDRMVRMLRAIPAAKPVDIRELIVQQKSTTAAHEAAERPTPPDIAAGYCIDETLAHPPPQNIAVFDDVLTTGAHFVAARQVLASRFPQASIVGVFIARRAPEPPSFSAFFNTNED